MIRSTFIRMAFADVVFADIALNPAVLEKIRALQYSHLINSITIISHYTHTKANCSRIFITLIHVTAIVFLKENNEALCAAPPCSYARVSSLTRFSSVLHRYVTIAVAVTRILCVSPCEVRSRANGPVAEAAGT